MPLSYFLYVLVSLAAIGLLVLLMMRLGLSRQVMLEDEAEARAVFLTDYPDVAIREVVLSADRRAAMLALEGAAPVGLIRALGRFWQVTAVSPGNVLALSRNGAVLRLRLDDPGNPVFSVTLENEAVATEWAARLRKKDAS